MPATNTNSHRPPSGPFGSSTLLPQTSNVRVFKATNGKLDLADVTVVVSGDSATGIKTDLVRPPDAYETPTLWISAAIEGAELALWELRDRGRPTDGRLVTLTEIRGTVSDTRPQAVRCAAATAVWNAFAPDLPEPAVDWVADLRLLFPAASVGSDDLTG